MYTNGFLLNKIDFMFHRDSFLTHHSHIYLSREDYQRVESYDVDTKYSTDMMIGVIGEFFEREILVNTNKIRNNILTGVNILTGESRQTDVGNIVFDNKFVDSCGMASHTNSKQLIKKAVYEFYERQSFIFSFLSRGNSKKILLDWVADPEILCHHKYILNFVDNVYYYEMGLLDDLKVVLCLGYGSGKVIGLGTEVTLYKAIIKAQKEVLQNLAISCSKNNFRDIGFKYYLDDRENLYTNYFRNMKIEQLMKEYDYLENDIYVNSNIEEKTEINVYEIIRKLNKEYSIDPDIYFMGSKRYIGNLKIIKVIDRKWFPHMVPKNYNENIWNNIENITEKKLRRDIQIIPFP